MKEESSYSRPLSPTQTGVLLVQAEMNAHTAEELLAILLPKLEMGTV